MKKLIVVFLVFVLSACANSNGGTTVGSTAGSSASSGISSNQTISANNIYEIAESDVPVLSGADIQEMFESVQKEAFTDWDKKTDNETDLEDLLGGEVIAADMSWYFAKCLLYNTANGAFSLEEVPLPDPVFIRETGTFYSEALQKTIQRGYTVYKTELGGCLYVFMQHAPQEDETAVVATILLHKSQSSQSYSDIQPGGSINRVIELDPAALYFKKNFDRYLRKSTFHLLTDGVLEIVYSDDYTIKEMNYYDDFVLPNYLLEDRLQNIYLEPWAYNFTILPQDYPPNK